MPGRRQPADEQADPARRTDRSAHAYVDELAADSSDRWRWRQQVRAHPVQRPIYRAAVGLAGLVLVVLGCVSGPIPGPGGIPLVLLGLAVWSSEFVWARRVLVWFKGQLRRYQSWSRGRQVGFWFAFFAICGLCGYASMLVLGIPTWLPTPADALLHRLPGL